MRSTSGVHLAISGPATHWPIIGISKKQEATSHSTPEAEMVAASFAIRQKGLPFMHIWDTIRGERCVLQVLEDNDAMIRICQTGRNSTMRHIGRTHGISVACCKS